MDESTRPAKPNRLLGFSIHLLILLVGLASGAALIYSLQPPKPPPTALVYEMFVFSADKPVTDFTPYFEAQAYNAAQGVRLLSGGNMVGNIQFASTPGTMTRLNLALPDQMTPYTTLTGMQFDTRGDVFRDRLRTSIKVTVNQTEVSHLLELSEGEYRAVEIITGNQNRRKWCYAIIKVDRSQPSVVTALTLPNPVPASRTRGSTSADAK